MSLDLKTLRVRSITAAVFVAVLLSCIYLNYFTFLGLFFFVSIWALYEFYSLAEKMGAKPFAAVGMLSGILTFMSIYALQISQNSFDVKLMRYAIYLVPFIVAFANGNEALLESLSVITPEILALFWATTIEQTNKRVAMNFNFILTLF